MLRHCRDNVRCSKKREDTLVKKIKKRIPARTSAPTFERAPGMIRGLGGATVPNAPEMGGLVLAIACGVCGHVGRYNVGTVAIRPPWPEQPEGLQSQWGFTAYVRCTACDGARDWKLTPESELVVMRHLIDGHNERVVMAEMHTFDGWAFRFATESIDHLERLVAADPGNAALHDRLGNTWHVGGVPDRAIDAWWSAVKCDADFLPSLYSLGRALVDCGAYAEGAAHLNRCFLAARRSRLPRATNVDLLESALCSLLDAARATGGAVPFLPEGLTTGEPGAAPLREVRIERLNLGRHSDRVQFVEMLLGPVATPD